MSRVSRKHTWEHRISSMQLMQELGLDAIDFYVARRQLRWLGHVSRMGWERLPRRMLSAWVPHARPRGAPRLTYGRSVAKAMDVFNLDHARWPELAADRARWRAMLQSGEGRRLSFFQQWHGLPPVKLQTGVWEITNIAKSIVIRSGPSNVRK